MSVFTLQPERTVSGGTTRFQEAAAENSGTRGSSDTQRIACSDAAISHKWMPWSYVGCRTHAVWLTLPAWWAAVWEAFILMKGAQRWILCYIRGISWWTMPTPGMLHIKDSRYYIQRCDRVCCWCWTLKSDPPDSSKYHLTLHFRENE